MSQEQTPLRQATRVVPRWLLAAGVAAACVLLVGGAVWMVAELAQKLTLILVPILVALLVAGVFEPIVERAPRRLPSWVAPLAVVVTLLVVVLGGLLLIGQRLADEIPELTDDVRAGVTDVTEQLGIEIPSFLQDRGSGAGAGGSGSDVPGAGRAREALKLGAELLFGFFLTLALAFLFMNDGADMWRWSLHRLGPSTARQQVDRAGRAAWQTLGAYVRGLTIVAVFDAVGTAIGLLVLGVPLVVTLAALQLVGSYVPTFGALLAGAAAVLVAYVSADLATAGLTLLLVVAVQQIGNDVIEPWVMGRVLRLHPVAVLVAVSVGAVLWGIAGALLFVPLVAAGSAAARTVGDEGA